MPRSPLVTPLRFVQSVFLVGALAASGLLAACGRSSHPPHVDPKLRVEPITLLESAEPPIRVDRLLFRAGFRLDADSKYFGGFSGLEFSPDGSEILAVGDRGFWLRAQLVSDSEGSLTDFDGVFLGPLRDLDGSTLDHQLSWDSEEVVFLSPDEILVTFEHDHRAYRYALDEAGMPTGPGMLFPLPEDLQQASANEGLETATRLPDGRLLILTEGLMDENGDRIGWFGGTDDSGWQPFTLAAWEELQPTSATTLPDGRIVVLERSYSPEVGNRIRLSAFASSDLVPGARITPRELGFLAAPMTLDNMEAVAHSSGAHGETFLYLLSDDNFSDQQSTLFLQFELLPEGPPQSSDETPLPAIDHAPTTAESTSPGIEVTFLANEGFLLAGEQGSVLIDAFVAEPYSIYGALPSAIKEQMENAEPPFAEVQLALVSHQHRDHFQPEAAVAFLRRHPETLFVSSPEVVAALLQEAGDDSELEQRVQEAWPEPGTIESLGRGDIRVELFRLRHGGRFHEIQNLGHVIYLGGRKILHIGDAATAPETFAAYDLSEKDIDVALLPSWFFSSPEGRRSLDEHLRVRHRIACHISPRALAETRRALAESDPDVVTFENALESRRF